MRAGARIRGALPAGPSSSPPTPRRLGGKGEGGGDRGAFGGRRARERGGWGRTGLYSGSRMDALGEAL